MERFRHASEQMATVFYRKLPSWANASPTRPTDIEKPPYVTGSKELRPISNGEIPTIGCLDNTQNVFAWHELSLELHDGRNLLHQVSGKT